MAAFQFEIVSPEKLFFSGEVETVTVPGTDGEFTVFKDHAPVISSLKPGIVTVGETAAKQVKLYVPGGFAEVSPSGLTILADQVIELAELDSAKLEAAANEFEDEIARAQTDEARRAATEKRDQLLELKAALNL